MSQDQALEQVRALLEAVDKGMVVADREGRVLAANTQSPEIPGRSWKV